MIRPKQYLIATKFVLAILFALCLLDMPYSFYMFVRLIGCAGFTWLASMEYKRLPSNKILHVFWIVSAITINPFFKIPLGRELWNIVDIAWSGILVLSIIRDVKK